MQRDLLFYLEVLVDNLAEHMPERTRILEVARLVKAERAQGVVMH